MDRRALIAEIDRLAAGLARMRALIADDGREIDPADPLVEGVERLRRACDERGIVVSVDGGVNEAGAAVLLSRTASTLQRWRSEGTGPQWRRTLGRIEYDLEGIAAYKAGRTEKDAY